MRYKIKEFNYGKYLQNKMIGHLSYESFFDTNGKLFRSEEDAYSAAMELSKDLITGLLRRYPSAPFDLIEERDRQCSFNLKIVDEYDATIRDIDLESTRFECFASRKTFRDIINSLFVKDASDNMISNKIYAKVEYSEFAPSLGELLLEMNIDGVQYIECLVGNRYHVSFPDEDTAVQFKLSFDYGDSEIIGYTTEEYLKHAKMVFDYFGIKERW